jgi:hypothetical protein
VLAAFGLCLISRHALFWAFAAIGFGAASPETRTG